MRHPSCKHHNMFVIAGVSNTILVPGQGSQPEANDANSNLATQTLFTPARPSMEAHSNDEKI